MKYYIGLSNSDTSSIKITSKEFESLKRAQSILVNARAIEEKYDILISNYIDLEKFILSTTVEFMIRKDLDYSDFFDLRHRLNVHMVNFLTSARLYIDQLNRNVKGSIPLEKKVDEKVNRLKSKEYDTNQDYQFMEALRNYVQHCGLPVHLTNYNLSKRGSKKNDFFEYILSFYAVTVYLKKDERFKKGVLQGYGEEIDLKASIRGYVESLNKIHESIRGMIKLTVLKARTILERSHRNFKKINSRALSSLYAFKDDEKGQVFSIPLILDWDNNRICLQKRNKTLTNLKKRYVSNMIKDKNKKI
jgi:hypothetical protein